MKKVNMKRCKNCEHAERVYYGEEFIECDLLYKIVTKACVCPKKDKKRKAV